MARRIFHLPAGGNLSAYTQLYTAFLVSGLMHSTTIDIRFLRFFLSQAVAITFEDAIIASFARAKSKLNFKHSEELCRRIGYLWVYCWFIFSATPWIRAMGASGLFNDGGVKYSLILGLYRGQWHPVKS
jgi:hypothetical protein